MSAYLKNNYFVQLSREGIPDRITKYGTWNISLIWKLGILSEIKMSKGKNNMKYIVPNLSKTNSYAKLQ